MDSAVSVWGLQGFFQLGERHHGHPVEEQHQEAVTAGAAEGLPGGLVPRDALGWREGPGRRRWETRRGECTPASIPASYYSLCRQKLVTACVDGNQSWTIMEKVV